MNTLLLKRPQIALTYSRRQATFNETENVARKRRFASQINDERSMTNGEIRMTNGKIGHQLIDHSAFDKLRHRKASSNPAPELAEGQIFKFYITSTLQRAQRKHQHISTPAHHHIVHSAFDELRHRKASSNSTSPARFDELSASTSKLSNQHTGKTAH